MNRSTYRPTFSDTTRPLPFQMRHARWAEGEAGATGGEGTQTATGDTGAGAAGEGATTATTGGQAGTGEAQQHGSGDGLPDDPAALKTMIADLRRENGAARTNAKQQAADEARQALVQELGKALGLVKDGETPKPEELTAQVQAAQEAARQSAVELAVYRTATLHGGDPVALTDSRAFLAKVAALDPTAEDFTTQVTNAAKTAVTDNPKLQAQAATGASSVDHPGGSGEGAISPEQFKTMSGAERNDLARRDPTTYARLAGRQ